MTLKKSRFTVAVPYANAPGDYVIVYHTMTAAFVLIGTEDWNSICQAPDRSDSETRQFLRRQGFFVPCGTDETVAYQCWKDQHMHDFSTMTAKVLVTRRCHFTPILPRQGENAFHCGVGDPGIGLKLMAMAREHGLAEPLEAPCSLCLAERRARFVFDVDGSLIACPALNEGEQVYGHVDSGIDFVSEAQLLYRPLPEKCLEDCELLPMCRGGCRHQALVFQNDFNGIDCRYDAMYRHLEVYLQQRAAQVMDSGHEI